MNVTQVNKVQEIEKMYDEMIAEQRELKRQFQEKAQALFNNLVKDFFELNPAVNLIQWNQYTPYFNDGESCEFGVNEPYFSNATGDDLADIRWGEYEGENDDIWSESHLSYVLKHRDKEYYQTCLKSIDAGEVNIESCDLFSKMIQSSEFEDVMKDMFGDHVTVQITREHGIQVEDCEHD